VHLRLVVWKHIPQCFSYGGALNGSKYIILRMNHLLANRVMMQVQPLPMERLLRLMQKDTRTSLRAAIRDLVHDLAGAELTMRNSVLQLVVLSMGEQLCSVPKDRMVFE
jgi:hypothetical protein